MFEKIAKITQKISSKIKISSALNYNSKEIRVINRATQQSFTEKIYGEDAMKLVYGNPWLVKLTEKIITNNLLSKLYGRYNDCALSTVNIKPFIEKMQIDLNICEKKIAEYKSFNDFFARKLIPKARPICQAHNTLISPGDGRLLVFPTISQQSIAYIKWAPIDLLTLFAHNKALSQRYAGGACAILRLCPSDYHRFHFPAAGKIGPTKTIPGLLHSVNPYALEQNIPVYCLNKRTLAELDTQNFGNILIMEIGALLVGKIIQTYEPGKLVAKGAEKGFFKFGGSTCILFFEPNSIKFDEDLIKNSLHGLETLVYFGERIGISSSLNTL